MPRKSSLSSPKRSTKAASEGIAPTVRVKEEPKAKPEGYVFGRPTVWQDRFCDDVIEWGADGKSITWMAATIGITKETIYAWIKEKPAFSDAIERARVLCQKWWEDAGQRGMEADKFNSAVWQKNMAARFRDEWTDRAEVSGPGGNPIQHQVGIVEFRVIDHAAEG